MSDSFQELKSFLLYHMKNNPKRTLGEILPLLNELLRSLGKDPIKQQKEKK